MDQPLELDGRVLDDAPSIAVVPRSGGRGGTSTPIESLKCSCKRQCLAQYINTHFDDVRRWREEANVLRLERNSSSKKKGKENQSESARGATVDYVRWVSEWLVEHQGQNSPHRFCWNAVIAILGCSKNFLFKRHIPVIGSNERASLLEHLQLSSSRIKTHSEIIVEGCGCVSECLSRVSELQLELWRKESKEAKGKLARDQIFVNVMKSWKPSLCDQAICYIFGVSRPKVKRLHQMNHVYHYLNPNPSNRTDARVNDFLWEHIMRWTREGGSTTQCIRICIDPEQDGVCPLVRRFMSEHREFNVPFQTLASILRKPRGSQQVLILPIRYDRQMCPTCLQLDNDIYYLPQPSAVSTKEKELALAVHIKIHTQSDEELTEALHGARAGFRSVEFPTRPFAVNTTNASFVCYIEIAEVLYYPQMPLDVQSSVVGEGDPNEILFPFRHPVYHLVITDILRRERVHYLCDQTCLEEGKPEVLDAELLVNVVDAHLTEFMRGEKNLVLVMNNEYDEVWSKCANLVAYCAHLRESNVITNGTVYFPWERHGGRKNESVRSLLWDAPIEPPVCARDGRGIFSIDMLGNALRRSNPDDIVFIVNSARFTLWKSFLVNRYRVPFSVEARMGEVFQVCGHTPDPPGIIPIGERGRGAGEFVSVSHIPSQSKDGPISLQISKTRVGHTLHAPRPPGKITDAVAYNLGFNCFKLRHVTVFPGKRPLLDPSLAMILWGRPLPSASPFSLFPVSEGDQQTEDHAQPVSLFPSPIGFPFNPVPPAQVQSAVSAALISSQPAFSLDLPVAQFKDAKPGDDDEFAMSDPNRWPHANDVSDDWSFRPPSHKPRTASLAFLSELKCSYVRFCASLPSTVSSGPFLMLPVASVRDSQLEMGKKEKEGRKRKSGSLGDSEKKRKALSPNVLVNDEKSKE